MAQYRFDTPIEGRVANLEKTLNKFIKESFKKQKDGENIIWGVKKSYDHAFKAQASSIKKLEIQVGKIVEIVQNREAGSLPSSTETNLRGLAHAITTRNKHKNDGAKNGNAVRESEAQRKVVKSYIPPIPFPRRLKKEKNREKFKKFFKNLQQLSINIPFVEALEQMPKYAKFMKDILTNKAKFEETSKATLNKRCLTVLLNEIPLKEKDPGSFTIPCAIGKICIDLGASISLMPYSMFISNQEFPVIISSLLSHKENDLLLQVFSKHKAALAWKVADIKGISPSFCMHKILKKDNFNLVVQPQRRLNPKVQDVVKAEIVKLLDPGLIYAISDSPWISPIHVVPKKGA
ncbi:hypothetical protein Tco_0282545 [Tanacetum coccineum]